MQDNINDEDSAQTIGEILRHARTKQGKTLHAVAETLCIRTTYLEAIENMDLKNIPEPPYGIGFIRSYAEYLGLNGERIISSYKQTIHSINKKSEQISEKKPNTSRPKLKHIILGLLGLCALIYVWYEWPLYQEDVTVEAFENSESTAKIPQPLIIDATDTTVSEDKAETAISDTDVKIKNTEMTIIETVGENLPLPSEIIAVEPKDDNTGVANTIPEIKMVIKGPSWVELKVNGQVILSKTLQKGFEYVIKDAEHTTVTAGRHYNVKFYVDGQEVKVLSARQSKNVSLKKLIKKEN